MKIPSEGAGYELSPVSSPPAEPRAVGGRGAGASFAQALSRVGRAVDGGEALIASAARGNLGGLDSAQLIALQAGIYRYSEAVDLVAKLVDRAATSVKTIVSSH